LVHSLPDRAAAVSRREHLREREEVGRKHVLSKAASEGLGPRALVPAVGGDVLEGDNEVAEELAPSAVLLVDI
jgi:hypothetical protein